MVLKEYWRELKNDIEQFLQNNKIKPSNNDDKNAFEKCITFLRTMRQLGEEIENTSYTILKTSNGLKLKELAGETFGDYRTLDYIPGALTLAFVQQVYLPHLHRFSKVTLNDQNYSLRIFTNLPSDKQDTVNLAAKLDKAISRQRQILTVQI